MARKGVGKGAYMIKRIGIIVRMLNFVQAIKDWLRLRNSDTFKG